MATMLAVTMAAAMNDIKISLDGSTSSSLSVGSIAEHKIRAHVRHLCHPENEQEIDSILTQFSRFRLFIDRKIEKRMKLSHSGKFACQNMAILDTFFSL